MTIVKSVEELLKYTKNLDSVGFVPTMGALHQGDYLSLKSQRREQNG